MTLLAGDWTGLKDPHRKTFIVDGRGVDIDCLVQNEKIPNDESYYEVSMPGVKEVLAFAGPPNMFRSVLHMALGKWHDMGRIPRETYLFPANQIKELTVSNIIGGSNL